MMDGFGRIQGSAYHLGQCPVGGGNTHSIQVQNLTLTAWQGLHTLGICNLHNTWQRGKFWDRLLSFIQHAFENSDWESRCQAPPRCITWEPLLKQRKKESSFHTLCDTEETSLSPRRALRPAEELKLDIFLVETNTYCYKNTISEIYYLHVLL